MSASFARLDLLMKFPAVPASFGPVRPLVVTASLVLLAGGCRSTEEPAASGWADVQAEGQDIVPQYETTRSEMDVGQSLAQVQPTLMLRADEMTLAFQLPSSSRIEVRRVEGDEQIAVAVAEAVAGQLIVVDRKDGVRLGRQVLSPGPLQREAEYALYVLPPGGVRQEVTRTTIRPPTSEEIESAREARLEREAEARRATREPPPEEAPTTGPSP